MNKAGEAGPEDECPIFIKKVLDTRRLFGRLDGAQWRVLLQQPDHELEAARRDRFGGIKGRPKWLILAAMFARFVVGLFFS